MVHLCVTVEKSWPRKREKGQTKTGICEFYSCANTIPPPSTSQEQAEVAAALAKVTAAYEVLRLRLYGGLAGCLY